MLLSDKDIEERLQSPDNLINRLTVHEIERGRSSTSIAVPLELKKMAAILSVESAGSTRELEKQLGISRTTINNAENGKVGDRVEPELKETIKAAKERLEGNRITAESLAVDALLSSLKILPAALSHTTKAKDISSVAKDMAAVAQSMGGRSEGVAVTAHLHLYAPKQKQVDDYEVIDV